MASTPEDLRQSLEKAAERAGKAIRDELQDKVESAQEKKEPFVMFEVDNYRSILGTVMEKFEKDFPTRHPIGQLAWGKGIIILQPKAFSEDTLDQRADSVWMLALATSTDKTPGSSLGLRGTYRLANGDVYMRYTVSE